MLLDLRPDRGRSYLRYAMTVLLDGRPRQQGQHNDYNFLNNIIQFFKVIATFKERTGSVRAYFFHECRQWYHFMTAENV